MPIHDSRYDRRLFSARIDALKTSIAALREHVDGIFALQAPLTRQTQITLAEMDVHLNAAAEQLGETQRRLWTL